MFILKTASTERTFRKGISAYKAPGVRPPDHNSIAKPNAASGKLRPFYEEGGVWLAPGTGSHRTHCLPQPVAGLPEAIGRCAPSFYALRCVT